MINDHMGDVCDTEAKPCFLFDDDQPLPGATEL